jgi:DNA sulfur modification protein DndD
MILTELILRDFCLYAGEQVLELAPVERRGRVAPIVLFGGINGGGKTTVLDAVQLALYGNRARCSKRGDKSYEQFLRESIHRGADPQEGASIQLSFRYASEGQQQVYSIRRAWAVSGDRVREKVQVARDGVDDGWLSENWNQLVEELIPLGIAQLCFFDAEKIRFLAEDETSMQALGDAIKSLLGLDLIERLAADAAVLEGRIVKRAHASAQAAVVGQLEAELKGRQTEIDRLVRELGGLENLGQKARSNLQEIEERFARLGGRHWEEREALARRRGELEQSLREAESRLVGLAATDLPLALVSDLLRDVQRQAVVERQEAEAAVIARLLDERDAALLKRLQKEQVDRATLASIREYLREDRQRRAEAGMAKTGRAGASSGWSGPLQLSEAARQQLDHLLQQGQAERGAQARDELDQLQRVERQLQDVAKSLAAAPDEAAVAGVVAELKAASAELAGHEARISRLEKELASLRSQRDDLQRQLARHRRKIVDQELSSQEDSRLARLLVRTQTTMQDYLRRATQRKIGRLAQQVTESFRFLLRKQTLVQRVEIAPDTFAVRLYDDTGQAVPKERLSEGEKQIFAVSVLWGLSRSAARPLPAIIDTPMARLDAKHRDKLVERYFPHASHQVIILSTDTEIERQYFERLEPHVARAYHLNYDDQQKRTVAEAGRFFDF